MYNSAVPVQSVRRDILPYLPNAINMQGFILFLSIALAASSLSSHHRAPINQDLGSDLALVRSLLGVPFLPSLELLA